MQHARAASAVEGKVAEARSTGHARAVATVDQWPGKRLERPRLLGYQLCAFAVMDNVAQFFGCLFLRRAARAAHLDQQRHDLLWELALRACCGLAVAPSVIAKLVRAVFAVAALLAHILTLHPCSAVPAAGVQPFPLALGSRQDQAVPTLGGARWAAPALGFPRSCSSVSVDIVVRVFASG